MAEMPDQERPEVHLKRMTISQTTSGANEKKEQRRGEKEEEVEGEGERKEEN